MNQNFLTVDELAEKFRVSRSWVYSSTRETGLRSIPRSMLGKCIRFVESEVMEWLKRQNELKLFDSRKCPVTSL